MGKQHGTLAKAGKVRKQTPKVQRRLRKPHQEEELIREYCTTEDSVILLLEPKSARRRAQTMELEDLLINLTRNDQ